MVVIVSPRIDDATRVAEAGEPVLRQAFMAQPAVEALDVGVLHGLAGLDEAQFQTPACRPFLHRAAGKLGRQQVLRDETRPTTMKLFGNRDSANSESIADRMLYLAGDDIAARRAGIPVNIERGKFNLASWNSDAALRRHLERVALLARAKNDYAQAREELSAAQSFSQTLEDAVNLCNERGFNEAEKNFIHLMNFTSALLLLMLRQDWPRLKRLVAMTALPVVKEEGLEEESGGALDVIARMLVATLNDDAAQLATAQRRFQAERMVDRYFEVYFEYDRMMTAIVVGDAKGLADFLAALEVQFARRATDKELLNQELLKAAGEDNALVFDVWAVALALWARHQGIEVTHSSSVIPLHEFGGRQHQNENACLRS